MRVVVQKAENASCLVNNRIVGSIAYGYVLLVGFTHNDTKKKIELLAKKIIGLRIFEDENGKLNKSIKELGGSILAISQFTLYGDCKKGNRPSFVEAMDYEKALVFYEEFIEELKKYDIVVEQGVFGADMKISFTNVGPTTIWLDSDEL